MSVYSLSRSFQLRVWIKWLEEEWVCGEERQWILRSFVHHGLVPLLKKKGYILACSTDRLVITITRELFYIRERRKPKVRWHSTVFNTEYTEEEEDHYNYIMDADTWDSLWEGWSYLFDEDCINERFTIQHAVWTCLDLERSPQTAALYELGEPDADEPTGFKPRAPANDPYLMDMNEGYHDKFY
jgi:hypothetical protein